MTRIQQCALRDAESDFADRKPAREWRRLVTRIREGDSLTPALAPLQAVGVDQMCRSWGVDPRQWDARSGEWLREYASCYASTIEVLLHRQQERPS